MACEGMFKRVDRLRSQVTIHRKDSWVLPVRSSPAFALSVRLTVLMAELIGSDPEQSKRAASYLTNSRKSDLQFNKSLVGAAKRHPGSPRTLANRVILINNLEARELMLHSNEVSDPIRRASDDGVQFQQSALLLDRKLQARE
jgi:hypothetical protein